MTDARTMQDRIDAWGEDVTDEFEAETAEAVAAAEALGITEGAAHHAIAGAKQMSREDLLFTLSVTVAEVIGRWGVEATQACLSDLLETPAIAAIGGIVHAQRVIDEGGIPVGFMTEDLEEFLNGPQDDEYTDTGEEL